MIDKVKYQHQIIDEIYGFDNENKIGKDVRLEILKDVIRNNFSKTSLYEFQSNNGNIKQKYNFINKTDNVLFISSFCDELKKCIITVKSDEPFVCKIWSNESSDFWNYQELFLYCDINNPFYTIITKCINHEAKILYGYDDISHIQDYQKFGFSWDGERSSDFAYLNSQKVIDDLNRERINLYNQLRDQDSKLVLQNKNEYC